MELRIRNKDRIYFSISEAVTSELATIRPEFENRPLSGSLLAISVAAALVARHVFLYSLVSH